MKSQGEIEASMCEGIARFEQEYMGRGPKRIHAHLLGDLLLVRLQGVLTAADPDSSDGISPGVSASRCGRTRSSSACVRNRPVANG